MRLAVAMSGGVDSSVAAYLLKKQGHEVIGISLNLWKGGGRCCRIADLQDAGKVCRILRIPHYILPAHEIFRETVVNPFIESYLQGRTPIPCIPCNRVVKFSWLLNYVKAMGMDGLATGHYIIKKSNGKGLFQLFRAKDKGKDQSYFLIGLTQKELPFLHFPLGELTKEEVRKLAEETHLPIAKKPESQEVCFLENTHHEAFILQHRPGDYTSVVVDEAGNILGKKDAYFRFTVGQRQGLGISHAHPLYVKAIIPEEKKVLVASREKVYFKGLETERCTWVTGHPPSDGERVLVKVRHNAPPAPAKITTQQDKGVLWFDQPQWAITPGQAAVVYRGEELLGGGTITKAWRNPEAQNPS